VFILCSTIQKYKSVFTKDLPPKTPESMKNAIRYEIKLKDPNCRPIASRERRRSPEEVQSINDATREMQKAGLIEDSISPWSSQFCKDSKVNQYKSCFNKRTKNELTQNIHDIDNTNNNLLMMC